MLAKSLSKKGYSSLAIRQFSYSSRNNSPTTTNCFKIMQKIRILWVDDRGQDGPPEDELPEDLCDYFEIVPKNVLGESASFMEASDFVKALQTYILNCGKDVNVSSTGKDVNFQIDGSDGPLDVIFPCELLVTDYDLGYGVVDPKDGRDFTGLILNVIYGCLTVKHPSALVSITSFSFTDFPRHCHILQSVVEPFLGVSFKENPGLGDRTWGNIVKIGVRHLRNRIKQLYAQGTLVISMEDLVALDDGEGTHITFKSPFATRTLPIAGLFYDVEEGSKRQKAVRIWSAELWESLKIKPDDYIRASKLCNRIWEVYSGTDESDLFKKYMRLSELHIKLDRQELESTEYEKLYQVFKPKGKVTIKCTNNVCCIADDVFTQGKTDVEARGIRRMAAFLLILRLIMQMIDKYNTINDTSHSEFMPELSVKDIYLLLFPIPEAPFPTPWVLTDNTAIGNKTSTWKSWLKDNLAINSQMVSEPGWIHDVLHKDEMQDGERYVIRDVFLDECKRNPNVKKALKALGGTMASFIDIDGNR